MTIWEYMAPYYAHMIRLKRIRKDLRERTGRTGTCVDKWLQGQALPSPVECKIIGEVVGKEWKELFPKVAAKVEGRFKDD